MIYHFSPLPPLSKRNPFYSPPPLSNPLCDTEGEWADDQRNGQGKFSSHETQMVYVGQWLQGSKHGTGVMYLPNGDSFEGRWEMGKTSGPVHYNFAVSSPWAHPEY